MVLKPPAHAVGCDCSVCWVKHYCDALKLFPDPQPQHPPLFIVNYGDSHNMPFPDCNMTPVTTLSGRKA